MVAVGGHTAFVGRDGELRLLQARLAEARAGAGSAVLLAGEPGIGKTRLIEEFAARAAQSGAQVLWGRGYEGEGAPAYWPWLQILRVLVRSADRASLRTDIASGAVDIAQIVPELRERLPDLPAPPTLDPEAARFRLFDSIATFFARSAVHQPLVLLLDDLHWADRPSLLLLRFLLPALRGSRLLIVGTYRDVEVDRSHPLTPILVALARERMPEPILLCGFDANELAGVILAATGAALDSALLSAVRRETEGNPFFATEIVRLLSSDGSLHRPRAPGAGRLIIPPTVRETIGRRLDRLSPECLDVLTAAAVIGRDFDLYLLERVSELGRSRLLTVLEEAEGSRIIVTVPGALGRYRFTHALIRDTFHNDLPSSRRMLLHRQVGEALEDLWEGHPEPPLAELSHHFFEAAPAGEADRAVRYAVRAAQHAAELFAYEEAARLYEAALAALRLEQPVDCIRECDLLLALGEALLAAGEPRRAVDEVAPVVLARAEALSDHVRASRACQLALEGLFRYGVVTATATPEWRQWAEQADRYAEPDTADRVRADMALSFHHFSTHSDPAWELGVRALELARRLDDSETLFSAAFAIVNWPWRTREQWGTRLRLAAEFAEYADVTVSARTRGRLLFRGGAALLSAGDRDTAESLWRAGEALISRTRDPFLRLHNVVAETVQLVLDGRLEAALDATAQLIMLAEEFGSPMFGRQYGLFLRLRPLVLLGRADEGLAELRQLREAAGHAAPWWWDVLQALYEGHAGRGDDAGRAVRRILRERGGQAGNGLVGVHLMTQLLEGALLGREREVAQSLATWLAPVSDLVTVDYGLTSVARHLGATAALLGDPERAHAQYERALAIAQRVRFRPEAALCRLQLAELIALHDPKGWDQAHRLLDAAMPELEDMTMQPALERTLNLLKRLSESGHRRPAAASPDNLTAREVEVLRLLATGCTNQEIADALVLSVKTVERHVANIYTKIGAHNRAEATSYTLRHSLS